MLINSQLPPVPSDLTVTVQRALAEDVGDGDLTASLITPNQIMQATVITREPAVICGIPWFNTVFQQVDETIQINWLVKESQLVEADQTLCEIQGDARHLLTAERSALNFLQLLSGVATRTYQYAQRIQHTKTKILDTRKTIPGLRSAQKYAVCCGGGKNHRIGLYDMVLIKENHISAAGSITHVLKQAAKIVGEREIPIEIEVTNMREVEEAIDAGATRLLLDNFTLDMLHEAVQWVDSRASLEASGNVSLETLTEIAETGIDFISIGKLTKDVQAIDLSMLFKQ